MIIQKHKQTVITNNDKKFKTHASSCDSNDIKQNQKTMVIPMIIQKHKQLIIIDKHKKFIKLLPSCQVHPNQQLNKMCTIRKSLFDSPSQPI